MSDTMRAIGVEAFGPADNFKELSLPKPGAPAGHDILVRVKAVSVNPVDYKMRTGSLGGGVLPHVFGYDAAGVVEAVGDAVTLFKVGEEVFYAGAVVRQGSNAELQLVDERIVGKKPSNLSSSQAAAIPLVWLTAAEALYEQAHLTPENAKGKTILNVAGAGGVGSVASQLAKNVLGMRVISTASRPESAAYCKAHGADFVIDHSNKDGYKAELAKHPELTDLLATPASGVDVAFCCVDLDTAFDQLTEVVKPGGKILSITLKDPTKINVFRLFGKRLTLSFELMFTKSTLSTEDIATQHKLLNEASKLLEEGKIVSTMTSDVELTAANLTEAHKKQESGKVMGKQVLHWA
jgi:NADPH:quinone reductase